MRRALVAYRFAIPPLGTAATLVARSSDAGWLNHPLVMAGMLEAAVQMKHAWRTTARMRRASWRRRTVRW